MNMNDSFKCMAEDSIQNRIQKYFLLIEYKLRICVPIFYSISGKMCFEQIEVEVKIKIRTQIFVNKQTKKE